MCNVHVVTNNGFSLLSICFQDKWSLSTYHIELKKRRSETEVVFLIFFIPIFHIWLRTIFKFKCHLHDMTIKHQSGLKCISSYIDYLKVLTRLSFFIVLLYCLSCQLLVYLIEFPNLIKNVICLPEYYMCMYAFLLLFWRHKGTSQTNIINKFTF